MKENFFEANMDKWIAHLPAGHTIPSELRPLTVAEANTIVALCDAWKQSAKPPAIDWTNGPLAALKKDADAMQKKIGTAKVFFKLSCRSPKDAGARGGRFDALYASKREEAKLPDPGDEMTVAQRNTALGLMYQSSLEA